MFTNYYARILTVLIFTTMFSGLSLKAQVMADSLMQRNDLIGKSDRYLKTETSGLQPEAYRAFLAMKEAARKDSVCLMIVSGYRNFERQKGIWERKYKAYTGEGLSPEEAIQKIIEYSTIPGTSRHHWGTDMDIVDSLPAVEGDVLKADLFHDGGPYEPMRRWMETHAKEYGFYLVYTAEEGRAGFKYEPWHYSYKAIAQPMLRAYGGLDVKEVLREEALLGSEYFTDEFIDRYTRENILDINPDLLP